MGSELQETLRYCADAFAEGRYDGEPTRIRHLSKVLREAVTTLSAQEEQIERLREALLADTPWRTMDSAPKDGTPILAKNDRSYAIISWRKSLPGDFPREDPLPRWRVEHGFTFAAAHWMPLPARAALEVSKR